MVYVMKSCRPPLFRNRQFEPSLIVTCVRWYLHLRFALGLRNIEELMTERGLSVEHTTVWRWTQNYGPEVYRRLCGEVKRKSSTWHMDETYVRIAGRWMYLFRAVDTGGQTVDFYLSETRNCEAARFSCLVVGPKNSAQIERGVLWPVEMKVNKWIHLLAYVTGLVNQELLLQNEYLAAENRILRAHLPARLRLSDPERSMLAEIGKRLGRKALAQVACVAKPDTILAWYRQLIAHKFDGSKYRRYPGRP
jgi:hypothetical protein